MTKYEELQAEEPRNPRAYQARCRSLKKQARKTARAKARRAKQEGQDARG